MSTSIILAANPGARPLGYTADVSISGAPGMTGPLQAGGTPGSGPVFVTPIVGGPSPVIAPITAAPSPTTISNAVAAAPRSTSLLLWGLIAIGVLYVLDKEA